MGGTNTPTLPFYLKLYFSRSCLYASFFLSYGSVKRLKQSKENMKYTTTIIDYQGTAIMVKGESYMITPGNWVKVIDRLNKNLYKVYQAKSFDLLPSIIQPQDDSNNLTKDLV